jgi:hypothetical protein
MVDGAKPHRTPRARARTSSDAAFKLGLMGAGFL